MSRILLAYSTIDGHTRKICERLCRHLESDGHAVTLAEIGEATRGPDGEHRLLARVAAPGYGTVHAAFEPSPSEGPLVARADLRRAGALVVHPGAASAPSIPQETPKPRDDPPGFPV